MQRKMAFGVFWRVFQMFCLGGVCVCVCVCVLVFCAFFCFVGFWRFTGHAVQPTRS